MDQQHRGKDVRGPVACLGISGVDHERMERLGLGLDGLDDLEVTLGGPILEGQHPGTIATAGEGSVETVVTEEGQPQQQAIEG